MSRSKAQLLKTVTENYFSFYDKIAVCEPIWSGNELSLMRFIIHHLPDDVNWRISLETRDQDHNSKTKIRPTRWKYCLETKRVSGDFPSLDMFSKFSSCSWQNAIYWVRQPQSVPAAGWGNIVQLVQCQWRAKVCIALCNWYWSPWQPRWFFHFIYIILIRYSTLGIKSQKCWFQHRSYRWH